MDWSPAGSGRCPLLADLCSEPFEVSDVKPSPATANTPVTEEAAVNALFNCAHKLSTAATSTTKHTAIHRVARLHWKLKRAQHCTGIAQPVLH